VHDEDKCRTLAGRVGAAGRFSRDGGGKSLLAAGDWRPVVNRKDLVSGVLLIAIGLIFLASNLGTMPEVNFARLWPLILVVIGAGKLIAPGDEGRWSGVTLILIAAIFLAHNYRVIRLHDSWPLFIVIAGLSVMFGARRSRRGSVSS